MKDIIISMEIGDKIAFIACIISIICAVTTFLQLKWARKDYLLQKKIYSDGISKIDLSISDNFIYDDKYKDNVYFFFGIFISNLSDKQISIKKYTLSLLCEDNIIYKPDLSNEDIDYYNSIERLHIAQNIDAHNSIAGWCMFSLSRKIYNKINIDTYVLAVEDIHNTKSQSYSVLLREDLLNYEISLKDQKR